MSVDNILWNNAMRESERIDELFRPSVVFRPRLFIDGNQWCALYGDNIMDGVAGFGSTPDLAMRDFDNNWLSQTIDHFKPLLRR